MTKLFVAYSGENPASVDIKGHRLVILSNSFEDMANGLPLLGADAVREIEVPEDPASLAGLAATVQGGVVVSPDGTPVSLLLLELEKELPWVH